MTTTYYRFNDLVARGIVRNRTTLARWQKDLKFPEGILAGPNTRLWDSESIDRWIAERPAKTPTQAA